MADGTKLVASNRRARRNFDIADTFEAGMVLVGSEVKSLREANVQIADGYVRFDRGQAWLQGVHIAPYLHSQGFSGHDPDRHRKLLMHRREIDRLSHQVDVERVSVVPLSIYFRNGRAKVELGVGKGRNTIDKRDAVAKRDAEREMHRELRNRNR